MGSAVSKIFLLPWSTQFRLLQDCFPLLTTKNTRCFLGGNLSARSKIRTNGACALLDFGIAQQMVVESRQQLFVCFLLQGASFSVTLFAVIFSNLVPYALLTLQC
jgi:hypothetical protein